MIDINSAETIFQIVSYIAKSLFVQVLTIKELNQTIFQYMLYYNCYT
jgi:hypothetical protein